MGLTKAEKHNRMMEKIFSEAESEGRGLHGVYDLPKYRKAMLKKHGVFTGGKLARAAKSEALKKKK